MYTITMPAAARAIIIKDDKLLLMHRNKYGNQYYTLVGGRLNEGESPEQGLVREVKEETGLDITVARLAFIENHPEPYNQQYIFLCAVAPHQDVALQDTSEEAFMNRFEANIHKPTWVSKKAFEHIEFRTPQLHAAIVQGVKKGFPQQPVQL